MNRLTFKLVMLATVSLIDGVQCGKTIISSLTSRLRKAINSSVVCRGEGLLAISYLQTDFDDIMQHKFSSKV